MQPYYILVADAPPNTAPKKIPTPEPKFAVVAISHVKGEFKYGSGMIELCLYDFNGPSLAFLLPALQDAELASIQPQKLCV